MLQNHEFNLHVSRFYCLFLALMLFGSSVIVVMLPLVWWQRAILFFVVIAYGAVIFWRFALLRAKNSIIRLRKIDEKSWQITTRSGVSEVMLRGDSTVTPVMSILRFEMAGKRQTLVSIIFRDSLPKSEYRRLVSVARMG